MLTVTHRRRAVGVTLVVLALLSVEIWALNTQVLRDMQVDFFGSRSARDMAWQLDLLLVVPLALLVMAIAWEQPAWLYRRVKPWLPNRSTIMKSLPWMLLPLAYWGIAALPLPAATIWIILGAAEVVFTVLLGIRLVRIGRQIGEARREGHSLVTALQVVLPRGFGSLQLKLALRLSIIEFALLYYSIIGWFLPKPRKGAAFRTDRGTGNTVLIGIIMMVCIEVFPVHFLARHYSTWVAWLLTASSIYALMWALGEISARRNMYSQFIGDKLRLNHGLRGEVVVPLDHIVSVGPVGDEEPEASLGSESRLLIRLSEPIMVFGWFGREIEAMEIGFDAERPEQLLEEFAARGMRVEPNPAGEATPTSGASRSS